MSIQFKRVHCLFEQSGVFRDAFRALGYPALDYDIHDTFGRIDRIVDLLAEIGNCYKSQSFYSESFFSRLGPDDLVFAFFPCTYFETQQSLYYTLNHANLSKLSLFEKCRVVVERVKKRDWMLVRLFQLVGLADDRGFKLIVENPYHLNFLTWGNNFPKPTLVDINRRRRGDFFVKPTAYWFFNCSPSYGQSYVMPEETKSIANMSNDNAPGKIDRSLISPEYAKNFINDFIFGGSGNVQQVSLAL